MLFLGKYFSKEVKITKVIQYFFGNGKFQSLLICSEVGLNPKLRLSEINKTILLELQHIMKTKYKYGQELKDEIKSNFQKIKKQKTKRSFRHANKLPVRGQRTKTNAQSSRSVKYF